MSRLNQEQLQLLDVLNKVRLALTNEFKSQTHPSPAAIFRELMKLEVVLMENKNKEDLERLIIENHGNLDVLINHLIVKPSEEVKPKKFNIKWKPEEKQKIDIPKVEVKPFVPLKPKGNYYTNPQHFDNHYSANTAK